MIEALSYPLGPLPWTLVEGLLRKTNEAVLATVLQNKIIQAEKMPDNSATIIDGIFIIQKVAGDQANFTEVAMFVLSMALKVRSMSQRIDVVLDTYKETSIKNSERLARDEDLELELKNMTVAQIVRQWGTFLGHVGTKSSLIRFLVEEARIPTSSTRIGSLCDMW